MNKIHAAISASVCLLAACAGNADAPAAPRLEIDPARISVSGLSSGAYMAHQFHLAFSDRLTGAALFAGGPYGCAGGDLNTALTACMSPAADKLFELAPLIERAQARAQAGQLAPLSGLAGDKVYVWHGSADATVSGAVSEGAAALYEHLDDGVQVERHFDQPFAHLLPVRASGGDCSKSESPYLGACGVDAVGEALTYLLGVPAAQVPESASGELRSIDARIDGRDPPGGDQALLYVPADCAAGANCGLHIAFHGCEQGQEKIGSVFAEQAGYNRWADAAHLVVLYPQAKSSLMPLNPKGCWDWWGYTGADYDTRQGAQIRWVAALARSLGAPLD